jgi:toxin CcdB
MPQFTVYKNKNPATRATYPFLLDVQTNLLNDLQTRVVIPLTKASGLTKKPIKNLMPTLLIEGDSYQLLTPQLAGILKSDLGATVANAGMYRDDIISALDFLITGI